MSQTETDNAWAAGFFDGEGSAYIRTPSKCPHIKYANLSITNTDLEVIERFRNVLGVGRVRVALRPSRPDRRTSYIWIITRLDHIRLVLDLIAPHIGSKKLVQCINALSQDTRLKRAW